jgi:hypothetical protein
MKKVFAIAALTLAVFSFSSCKKDYTCKCVQSIGGTVVNTVNSTINGSKKDAKESCENGTQTNGTASVTCTIQ